MPTFQMMDISLLTVGRENINFWENLSSRGIFAGVE